MPEYLTPGVYIEEFELGARPIEGVSTSTAGFLGVTERGPTTPELVTSWLQFQRIYGGYIEIDDYSYLPYAVEGFFKNGGQRCYIGRITASDAKKASIKLKTDGGNALTVWAVGEGSWGSRIVIKVGKGTSSTDANPLFKLSVFYWKDSLPDPLFDPETDKRTTPQPAYTEIWDDLSVIPTSPNYYVGKVNDVSNLIKINREGVSGQAGSDTGEMPDSTLKLKKGGKNALSIEPIDGHGNRTAIKVGKGKSSTDAKPLFKLSVFQWGDSLPNPLFDPETDTTTPPQPIKDKTETYDDISVNPESNDYFVKKVNSLSKLINISKQAGDSGEVPDPFNEHELKPVAINFLISLASLKDNQGNPIPLDGNPKTPKINLHDYLRDDPIEDIPGDRRGLTAFKEIDEISIVYAPNASVIGGLEDAIISHCENLKSRFAIIDAPKGKKDVNNLNPRNQITDTQYAAFYYPWIKIVSPVNQMVIPIPPGGYVAGIYARTDVDRGVHKAPANESVREATDLEFQITGEEQGILNPRGVNVIRAFPERGIRVWGARTLSSNTLWKYINVRRLFIYIEGSIERGTQWVVFEPNNEKLWARVRATITQFLTTVWRDGALMGTKVEEAFFVKCDRTTMTQDDIDNGKLICIIGIAPVKPAEFVIFRIAQWAGGSATTE